VVFQAGGGVDSVASSLNWARLLSDARSRDFTLVQH
jgi:hypothetical protein